MSDLESKIVDIIKRNGPLAGAELTPHFEIDPLLLLRECRLSKALTVQTIGTRYLRLDRRIDGFARLSPSILREFLTYSVVGLSDDPEPLMEKADELMDMFRYVEFMRL